MAGQPLLGRLVFMDIQVIQDQMQVAVEGGRHRLVQKAEEVHRRAPLPGWGQYLAPGYLEGRQQRLGAMAYRRGTEPETRTKLEVGDVAWQPHNGRR